MKLRATVGDVMNEKVKSVDMDDTIQAAAEIMGKHRIGSVLVMGEKRLKGIVTAEDIVYKHVAAGKGTRVSDIMTRNPLTIAPDRTIEEASRIMVSKSIKKLPVVEGSSVVGIITASDIVRVEPALNEVLMELLRMRNPSLAGPKTPAPVEQCEVCGNFSDDIEETDGVWTCASCAEK